MKKLILPVITVMLFVALLAMPALAQPKAAALAPVPAGTASPRDWNVYAPEGTLLTERIKGDSAILIDANTGKVLFEKDADTRRYPASTTKIMTCLLALESEKSLSNIVSIGSLPAVDFAPDSANIGLTKGELISFEDLLAGMMVKSGNDAADAVAIYVGGSLENFLDMMNQKAQELGMTGTHYTCTNGLANDKDHYTTSRDMARLAIAAVKYPEFVKLVCYSSYTIAPTNKTTKARSYFSTNELLGEDIYGYVYATGIKTGYTSLAKNLLVSSAKKDGMSLIAVDMYVDVRNNMWTDSVTMFEYGFSFYGTVNLRELLAGRSIPMTVKDAASTDPGNGNLELILKPQGEAYITDRRDVIQILKNDPSQFQKELFITKNTAPINRNDSVGTVIYYYDGDPVLSCELIASRNVAVMATPAPSASLAHTSDAMKNGTPAPGGLSDTSSASSKKTWPVIICSAVTALLLALTILMVRFWHMRRKGRRG